MMTTLLLAAALVSKTGIPYVTDEKAGPPDLVQAIKARRPQGQLWNLDRMLLHSPNFAKAWNTMFGTIRSQLSLPADLREVAIMAIAVINKADYEWQAHEPEFVKAGGTKEQLAALKKLDPKPFNDVEKAALQLTVEMTRNVQPKQATIDRMRKLIGDDQYVELAGTIAAYNMVSRFLLATGVEPEATK